MQNFKLDYMHLVADLPQNSCKQSFKAIIKQDMFHLLNINYVSGTMLCILRGVFKSPRQSEKPPTV